MPVPSRLFGCPIPAAAPSPITAAPCRQHATPCLCVCVCARARACAGVYVHPLMFSVTVPHSSNTPQSQSFRSGKAKKDGRYFSASLPNLTVRWRHGSSSSSSSRDGGSHRQRPCARDQAGRDGIPSEPPGTRMTRCASSSCAIRDAVSSWDGNFLSFRSSPITSRIIIGGPTVVKQVFREQIKSCIHPTTWSRRSCAPGIVTQGIACPFGRHLSPSVLIHFVSNKIK